MTQRPSGPRRKPRALNFRQKPLLSSNRHLRLEQLESRIALAVGIVADIAPLGNANPHSVV